MKLQRVMEIDALRAMAIFFVVFGHALCYLPLSPFACELIYSFHMPVMFSLSGVVAGIWCWKEDGQLYFWGGKNASAPVGSRPSRWKKIGRSARRLLVPYAFMGLIGVPVVLLLTGHPETVQGVWKDYFVSNHGLWYLPACFILICSLVVSECLTSMTVGRFAIRNVAAHFEAFMVLGVGLGLAGVVFVAYRLTHCDFLRSALSYWFSFYAGVFLSRRLSFFTKPSAWRAGVSFLVWFGLALLFAEKSHTLVGNVIKPFTGLAALASLAFVAHSATRIPVMAAIGKSTLAIYCAEAAVGELYFKALAPNNLLLAALYSLAFVLLVHGVRTAVVARFVPRRQECLRPEVGVSR